MTLSVDDRFNVIQFNSQTTSLYGDARPAGSEPAMLRYPQTATPSALLMALGLIGLLPCIALMMLRRRVFE